MPLTPPPPLRRRAARRYMRHGFDSPKLQRQACRAMRFFHACNTPLRKLLWMARGRGAYARWLTFRQSVNPLLFPACPAFDSTTRASIYNAKNTP